MQTVDISPSHQGQSPEFYEPNENCKGFLDQPIKVIEGDESQNPVTHLPTTLGKCRSEIKIFFKKNIFDGTLGLTWGLFMSSSLRPTAYTGG